MAIKDMFLNEVKIGNTVELRMGDKDLKGMVIAIDMSSVKIRRENGKEPVLSLDYISYYEISDEDNTGIKNNADETSSPLQGEDTPSHNTSKSIYPSPLKSPAERTGSDSSQYNKSAYEIESIINTLSEKGSIFFDTDEAPKVKTIKNITRNIHDASLKIEVNAIENSFDYAVNKAHEISPADYKIHEIIGKIKSLNKKYPLSKVPNNLLGAVYFRCKCDGLALEAYEKGDDSESAFVIAQKLHDEEKSLFFAIRHFITDKDANAYIYKYLLKRMIEEKDYSVLFKIYTNSLSDEKLFAYHSFIRAVLIANKKQYNTKLDNEFTESALIYLLSVFKAAAIGKKSEFAKHLTRLPAVKGPQPSLPTSFKKSDCPTFAAAERARMEEKNLVKAEGLYLKAIENKENPGAAVANLHQILMQRKNYTDCAKYLGKYGTQYMREEAYANLRKQLLTVAPYAISTLSKYEQEDKGPEDIFIIAQKAELEEKDLQKAINYYKKAIEEKQRLAGSVPNLVALYSRLEMSDEALELLNTTGKSVMDRKAFLNLKQSVLIKAKDHKYLSEIRDTFNALVDLASTIEKKTELMAAQATLLSKIEEYDEAIAVFKTCLSNCDKKNYPIEKRNKQRGYCLTGICNAYVRKRDLISAQEYAHQLEMFDPGNEFAKSILSGNIVEDSDLFEENIGITHINKYIEDKLEELSLDSEVKVKNLLEEGEFVGSQEKAYSIISSIQNPKNRSVNEEAKSNQYLAGAKLIRQILKRDEEIDTDKFNEQRFLYFIAEGTCAYANSRLYRTEVMDNLDVARYFYTQPMTIFNDSEKLRSSWAVATLRYIKTYFDSVENIRKEGSGIYQKLKDHNGCMTAIKKIIQTNTIITDVGVFTVGMIELLSFNTRIKHQVLSCILLNPFQGKILDSLAKILNMDVPDISSVEDLERIWDSATETYFAKRKVFIRLLSETIESLFAVGELQENFERLRNCEYNDFLNNTDKGYISNLYEIFSSIARYNEIAEFDYKADTLKRTDDARKALEEQIYEYPTFLSYEKILPQLEQIQIRILKESVQLYSNSEPQLSLTLSGDCSVEEDKNLVRVPIAYTNKANSQNADNVQMRIWGDDVENMEDTVLSRDLWIGDGRAREKLITFKVSDKVMSDQTFTFEVSVNYQFRKNMTEIEEASSNFILTVPLYSESVFVPIENKFKIISGGDPVHDPSMFYGRDKDITSIVEQIKKASPYSESGKCLALYGQTRTGKSSILYHLRKKLRLEGDEFIIIDMESLGKLGMEGNNIAEFLYKILRSLDKEIKKYHSEIKQALEERNIFIDASSLLSDKEQAQSRFNAIFDDIYEIIREQDKNYHIVLMIDEFTYIYDWIRQGTMTDRIMKFWKAFMQTHNIFAVIIGQDHMMQFIADKRFTNDFGTMELMKVSYLSKNDAQDLMKEPILYKTEKGEMISRYKEGALDRLYELTSGSAYLIGKICAGLVEYLNDTHSVFITRAHVDDYIKKMIPEFPEINFDSQYRDLSELGDDSTLIDQNKTVLRRIAESSNRKEYTPVSSVVLSEEDKKILDKLEQRDVVILNGDRCKIKVALYKEWLLQHKE